MSDGDIIEQFADALSMVYRVRKQLVEEGFAAILKPKLHTRPSAPRIFDAKRKPG